MTYAIRITSERVGEGGISASYMIHFDFVNDTFRTR